MDENKIIDAAFQVFKNNPDSTEEAEKLFAEVAAEYGISPKCLIEGEDNGFDDEEEDDEAEEDEWDDEEDDFDENACELMTNFLIAAVRSGHKPFIERYADTIRIYRTGTIPDGICFPLETENREIRELLYSNGFNKPFEEYSKCKIAIWINEGNASQLLAFDKDFQKELLGRFLDDKGTSFEELSEIVRSGDISALDETIDVKELEYLGVFIENGNIYFAEPDDCNILCEYMEELWCEEFVQDEFFEDDDGSYESYERHREGDFNGVCYII